MRLVEVLVLSWRRGCGSPQGSPVAQRDQERGEAVEAAVMQTLRPECEDSGEVVDVVGGQNGVPHNLDEGASSLSASSNGSKPHTKSEAAPIFLLERPPV